MCMYIYVDTSTCRYSLNDHRSRSNENSWSVLFVFVYSTYDFPDQLTCYTFDNAFSLRAEAAIYSVRQLEKKLGLKLGLIFFDTCYSSALAQKYLIDVFNGTTDYCNNDGKCLDRKKIVALFGDYSSHVSIAVSQWVWVFGADLRKYLPNIQDHELISGSSEDFCVIHGF